MISCEHAMRAGRANGDVDEKKLLLLAWYPRVWQMDNLLLVRGCAAAARTMWGLESGTPARGVVAVEMIVHFHCHHPPEKNSRVRRWRNADERGASERGGGKVRKP